MKKLFLVNKMVFVINLVFATLLLLSYALPYVFPKSFPSIAVLSLTVPVLIVVNLIFLVYWALRLKKQFLLSFLVLLLGFTHVTSLYRFGNNTNEDITDSFSVMSYNVRLFNKYKWIQKDSIDKQLVDFINNEAPDVLCLQEYHDDQKSEFYKYPYKYKKLRGNKRSVGQVIFSKFPIVNAGSLNFPNTFNNAIYADIVKGMDTIRVYNLHLESLRINPAIEKLAKEDSEKLYNRIGHTFVMQQSQAELFNTDGDATSHKKIICVDLNNTQYANVYKQIKGDMVDVFLEAGGGLGRTFNFKLFPMRIDFIFADPDFKIKEFKNYSVTYSDHYPVLAKLAL